MMKHTVLKNVSTFVFPQQRITSLALNAFKSLHLLCPLYAVDVF